MRLQGCDRYPAFGCAIQIISRKSAAENSAWNRKAAAQRFGESLCRPGKTDLLVASVSVRLPREDQAKGCNHNLLGTGPVGDAGAREVGRREQAALGLVREIVAGHRFIWSVMPHDCH